jgi:hypothetical protein
VVGLLWLRKSATESRAAPFSMAQVAAECWNRPGVKAGMPAAVQTHLMVGVYFSKLDEPPLQQPHPSLQHLG